MIHEVWALDNTVYRKCPMALMWHTNFGFYPTPMCVTLCTLYFTSSVRTDNRHITMNIQIAKVSGSNPTQRNVPVIFFTELGESSEYTVKHTSVYSRTKINIMWRVVAELLSASDASCGC